MLNFFKAFSIIQKANQVITQQNYKILAFFVQHSTFQFRKMMFPTSCTKGQNDQQSHDLNLRLKQVQNIYYFLNKPFLSLRERCNDENIHIPLLQKKKQAKINYFNWLYKIKLNHIKYLKSFHKITLKIFFLASFQHAYILKKVFLRIILKILGSKS
ncbi:hypothetical protein TTHERM_001086751 (macronuclear) [Tetrahymena thermophila SB210]|uniref:Uncharacterized protein n=1 Tax=Tetrahymena thermophila (strain SB210) TaxID=312017 RepID=W7XHP0_TETTS|nr:hypothetical protein TTHERM_001086751 [Tetrahymena thermophila SB210]EWS73941.1 hypothetical protein TTHERM_001086751 [Tetrahymena thermophila SB210]|eukprot:XP_012653522.1 hypothetical protein TTHERM_001086751 [Tetrahymena thermophila SB210]